MKLVDLTLKQFFDEVDSAKPAPGGGSVAALSGVLGLSLARMVGHLSVSKKKFLALDSHIQLEFKDVLQELSMIKGQMTLLIDQDTEAFSKIMKAYQLPKETDEEVEHRKLQIEQATLEAIMVPLKVATLSMSALNHLDIIIQYGNRQAISDLGVSILELSSAVEGACMNMLINLPSLSDEIAANQYRHQAEDLKEKAHQKRHELLDKIYQKL